MNIAIDYTSTLINIPTQKVDIVNLNKCKLPYDNNSIQAITITEVIEHLENYRCILREINRTLEPDGLVVISTPNILNLKSFISFFKFKISNRDGWEGTDKDIPEILAPKSFNNNVNQEPLNPVWPVIKTLDPLKILYISFKIIFFQNRV